MKIVYKLSTFLHHKLTIFFKLKPFFLLAILLILIIVTLFACGENSSSKTFRVELGGNATTGYNWTYSMDTQGIVKEIENNYVTDHNPKGLSGVGGTYIFAFEGVSPGEVKLHFVYSRSWEEDQPPVEEIIYTLVIDKEGCISELNDATESSQNDSNLEPVYQKISSSEAYKMMSETGNFILLDVRTESEYKEKRIPGAILLPNDEIKSRAEAELSGKEQLIFVYCRSGGRSASATKELVELGYTNVYDLGGIIDWPYETTSG